jgi:hypothetical protein
MNVSLHKALRIRSAVEDKIKGFDLKPVVSLDVDSSAVRADVSAVIKTAHDDLMVRLEQFRRLNVVLADLRTKIAAANVANGVEALLAEQGVVEREIAKVKALLDGNRTDVESVANKVARKIESLKTPTQTYGRHEGETLAVNVISSEDVKAFEGVLLSLRRRKDNLEDQRATINHRTDIEIGEDEASLLSEQGIV